MNRSTIDICVLSITKIPIQVDIPQFKYEITERPYKQNKNTADYVRSSSQLYLVVIIHEFMIIVNLKLS